MQTTQPAALRAMKMLEDAISVDDKRALDDDLDIIELKSRLMIDANEHEVNNDRLGRHDRLCAIKKGCRYVRNAFVSEPPGIALSRRRNPLSAAVLGSGAIWLEVSGPVPAIRRVPEVENRHRRPPARGSVCSRPGGGIWNAEPLPGILLSHPIRGQRPRTARSSSER
jgi:hypothetical protein